MVGDILWAMGVGEAEQISVLLNLGNFDVSQNLTNLADRERRARRYVMLNRRAMIFVE